MSSVISVTNLSKVYGSGFKALDNVSLDIKQGEIFALLGPNGAGKTTLISIVCGIVNPTSGSITIGGQTLQAADVGPGQYELPRGFSLTLQIKSTADAERMFEALASGGQVRLPLEKTFWAERFGMVTDRFGVPWIVNCEG